MGRSRYRILESQHPHFLTCTILNWIPLFTRPATVQIVLDALLYRQQQHNWRIYGYVILENHMHLLGLINQKNGLSRHPSGALGITGLQPKYRFQNRQSVF